MNGLYDSYKYFFDLLSLCPLLLILYYATPAPAVRRTFLTIGGIYLLTFIAFRLALFYLAFWLIVFFIHRFAFPEEKSRRAFTLRILALICIPVLVAPLILWKIYGDGFVAFFVNATNDPLRYISTKLWEIDMARIIIGPLGLSFSTFRALDLIIKTFLEKIQKLSLNDVLFYGFFPPVQIFGPIIEYEDIAKKDAKADARFFLYGLLRIAGGFFKVFVVASLLVKHVQFPSAPADLPLWLLWGKLFGYYFYVYMNFSGYSDIAIGASALFGFRIKENFNFPFLQTNIQDYWNCWHISLSHWARRNVYIPAGGFRPKTQYLALFLTMMAIALWHDISIALVVFGIYHGTLLCFYRVYNNRWKPAGQPATPLRNIAGVSATFVATALAVPLVFMPQAHLLGYYAALFGGW